MSGSEPAQQEELTLLFHGALQLSQALNGVYKATEAQLIKARNSLSLYGQVLGLLGKEVSQGQDAAQELRASLFNQKTKTTLILSNDSVSGRSSILAPSTIPLLTVEDLM